MAPALDSEIRTIAVIGAGALGQTIARVSALGGYSTILEDILAASLRRAGSEVRAALEQASITKPVVEAALARIEYASSIEDAARAADLVIEAVPDEFESKTEILTLLDKVARPATIFASTTHSLKVSDLARVTYRARKVLGMRFALRVDRTPLLEIVRGEETEDETIAACSEVGRRMGLRVLVIEDRPRSVAT